MKSLKDVHVAGHRVRQLAHDHVKSVVDDGLSFRPLHPSLEGGVEPLPEVLDGEVDEGGCTAVSGGDGAGLEVVGGSRAPEGHVQVGVDIDASGHDQLAGGVDHVVGGKVQPLPDEGDHAPVDVEVRLVAVRCGDDGAVFHQSRGHGNLCSALPSGGKERGWRPLARDGACYPTSPRRVNAAAVALTPPKAEDRVGAPTTPGVLS